MVAGVFVFSAGCVSWHIQINLGIREEAVPLMCPVERSFVLSVVTDD